MRRWLMISLGVLLMVAGVLASPLPIPFPLGFVLIIAGSALLIAHSKGFRRFVQYLRHRNDSLSRAVDFAAHRAPAKVQPVLHRTRPQALARHARIFRKTKDDKPMAIPFIRTLDAAYETTERLSPLIERLLANNPGPFTFKGTGVYIVGHKNVAVIDPGPLLPEHLEALKRALDGRTVTHILVTHTHADHSPAAEPLKQWSGAKTYGFGPHGSGRNDDGVQMEEGGDMAFAPDVFVKDGDVIAGDGFTFDCVYTPGHTSNHMCFALREEQALFTGDHVMGWSTTVVTPPDGDMAQYMASVNKLIMRDDKILYPTHGAPITDPKPFLAAYLAHRLERERQILACIQDGITTIPEMVARMYADVDKRLHPAASRSVLAHLIQLTQEGRIRNNEGNYTL